MRVSTRGSYEQALRMMQQLQSALDRTQQQITTGKRLLSPSEDPIAASRGLAIRESLARLEQFDRNATIAENRLGDEENILTGVNDTLQRVRELALQANNATQSNETRRIIAIEMREHLDQLVQLANQQDGNGRYLFSGNRDTTTPVTRSGDTFIYNGDQGQRLVQIGEGRQIPDGDSGDDVFFRIRNGNGAFQVTPGVNGGSAVVGAGSVVDPAAWNSATYTVRFPDAANYEVVDSGGTVVASAAFVNGDSIAFQGIEFKRTGEPAAGDEFEVAPSRFQSVFDTVRQLADAVDSPVTDNGSRAVLNNAVNAGLQQIDQALGKVLEVRTRVGSRLAAIESQGDGNSAFALTLQTTLSDLEDLDYAEALSRLSMEMTALEAAQQSFVRTRSLTLFDFL
jgi:flagellar hook-associated protein 3 FlgL